jgi:hypothetical protein
LLTQAQEANAAPGGARSGFMAVNDTTTTRPVVRHVGPTGGPAGAAAHAEYVERMRLQRQRDAEEESAAPADPSPSSSSMALSPLRYLRSRLSGSEPDGSGGGGGGGGGGGASSRRSFSMSLGFGGGESRIRRALNSDQMQAHRAQRRSVFSGGMAGAAAARTPARAAAES